MDIYFIQRLRIDNLDPRVYAWQGYRNLGRLLINPLTLSEEVS
jgi:hypothetical protein